MASGNSDSDKLLEHLKTEFMRFADSYVAAVKSGANAASKQILNSLPVDGNPSDIAAGKLLAAVKTGVRHAGKQLIGFGAEYFNRHKNGQ